MSRKILRLVMIVIVCALVAAFAVPPVFEVGEEPPMTDPPTNDSYVSGGEYWDIVDTSKAEYSYSEMVDDLIQLAGKSEGRLTYSTVGETLDGRKLYAAVLGNKNAERQIVISAGIHAREYMTPMLVMKQIEYYLYNYDSGSYGDVSFAEMFEKYSFCILPMCNPDGIALAQNGIDALRSEELRETVRKIYERDNTTTADFADMAINDYLKYWKANARGVDLNRNFDTAAWYENPVHKPCFADCRGEAPLSEPESRAMADYVKGLSNPVCSIAVHSRGEVIYFDCGQENTVPSLELAQLVSGTNGYSVSYNDRSVAAFDDWCIIKSDIPSVTVETGVSSCPLPIKEFEKIWNDNRDLWAAVACSGKY